MVCVQDTGVWLRSQNTQAKCQALATAFNYSSIQRAGYGNACVENDGDKLLCSTSSSCPNNHLTRMQGLQGVTCSQGGRHSICPCAEPVPAPPTGATGVVTASVNGLHWYKLNNTGCGVPCRALCTRVGGHPVVSWGRVLIDCMIASVICERAADGWHVCVCAGLNCVV